MELLTWILKFRHPSCVLTLNLPDKLGAEVVRVWHLGVEVLHLFDNAHDLLERQLSACEYVDWYFVLRLLIECVSNSPNNAHLTDCFLKVQRGQLRVPRLV